MRSIVLLCTLVLGGYITALGQQNPTSPTSPPGATPPTFPQSQTPGTPSNPETMPPDTRAPQPVPQTPSHESTGNASAQAGENVTIRGCLSKSGENYMLTDQTGTSYQLTGDTSALEQDVGREVAVKGMLSKATTAGSSSAPTKDTEGAGVSVNSTSATSQIISVKSAKKIASTCTSSAAAPSH